MSAQLATRDDPPLCIEEALLDVLHDWRDSISHEHRTQLAEAITRVAMDQRRNEMDRARAAAARKMAKPGWPIERASLFANAEGRN